MYQNKNLGNTKTDFSDLRNPIFDTRIVYYNIFVFVSASSTTIFKIIKNEFSDSQNPTGNICVTFCLFLLVAPTTFLSSTFIEMKAEIVLKTNSATSKIQIIYCCDIFVRSPSPALVPRFSTWVQMIHIRIEIRDLECPVYDILIRFVVFQA